MPTPEERQALAAWIQAGRRVRLAFEPRRNPVALDLRDDMIKGRVRPPGADADRERLRSLGYL
ncbi:hypothetical protein D3C83_238670 [compost metagenome]